MATAGERMVVVEEVINAGATSSGSNTTLVRYRYDWILNAFGAGGVFIEMDECVCACMLTAERFTRSVGIEVATWRRRCRMPDFKETVIERDSSNYCLVY